MTRSATSSAVGALPLERKTATFSCRQVTASQAWDSWNGGRLWMEEQSESDADDTQLLCTLAVVVVAVVVDDVVVVAIVAATSAAAAEAVASHALLVAEGDIWRLASQGNGVGSRGRLTARSVSMFWSCRCPFVRSTNATSDTISRALYTYSSGEVCFPHEIPPQPEAQGKFVRDTLLRSRPIGRAQVASIFLVVVPCWYWTSSKEMPLKIFPLIRWLPLTLVEEEVAFLRMCKSIYSANIV